jgi:hypothetical protein
MGKLFIVFQLKEPTAVGFFVSLNGAEKKGGARAPEEDSNFA